MKKLYAISALCVAATFTASAQNDKINDYNTTEEQGLIETIGKIEKKTDKFNLYLNMHGDFEMLWNGSDFQTGKFNMKQLRVEAKGDINDWLSYRYRQRLNKGDATSGYRDNLLNSIDIAGIGIKLKNWQFFLGKQCAAYGGIEFDKNPIEIYEYCDMIEYMSNFMSGVNIGYNFTPKQQLNFQVLNAINVKSEDMYGAYTPSKFPMVYTLNWNGNFGDVYKTRWSASVMTETKGKNMYYFALGNEFDITREFNIYFDWMYSLEGVDRKGIMTDIIGAKDFTGRNQNKADYMSFVLHLNYRIAPAWNIFAKGMFEMAGLYGDTSYMKDGHEVALESGKYRNSWGYIGGIEYYPFKDRNLHFFAAYVGRAYNYTDRAKAVNSANHNYNTNRLSLGFIWQMPVF